MNCCDLLYFAKCSPGPVNQNIFCLSLFHELIYIRSGCAGKIYFEGGEQDIEPNDIILLPPDVKYRFECDGQFDCILIGFDNFDCDFQDAPVIFKGAGKSVSSYIDAMSCEFEGNKYGRSGMLNLLLNTVLITLCRTLKSSESKKKVEADNFNYILNYMQAHSHNGINILEVSKMSGLSYHRFRHRFKEINGISPQQYIIKQRLNYAKKMLETTNYTTSLIAEACDFHSVPQFITYFNKQEGMTPVKYRKMHTANV